MQVDPTTGKPRGDAQKLSRGLGSIDGLSVTANGKRVVFLRDNSQDQVFIAELDPATRRLSAPYRLTLDENGNLPYAWTPDSRSVLFISNRNGTWKMFKQPIDQTTAEMVAEGRSLHIPRLSPDGSEILYMEGYRPDDPSVPVSIMRMSLAGGAPREVLRANGIINLQCARIPSRLCLFNTRSESTTTFFAFDPELGKSAEIARMTGTEGGMNWSLSPDGSLLAIIPYGEREDRIRFLSLPTGVARDVVVKDWRRLFLVDWSADGAGLLIPSATSNWGTGTPVLLFVDLEGKARVLWEGEKYGPLG
jgi:Tol biopolymer transport system component